VNRGGGAAAGDWQGLRLFSRPARRFGASATLLAVEPHTGGPRGGGRRTRSRWQGVTIPAFDAGQLPCARFRSIVGARSPSPALEKVDETGGLDAKLWAATVPALTVGTPAFRLVHRGRARRSITRSPWTAGENLLLTCWAGGCGRRARSRSSERFGLFAGTPARLTRPPQARPGPNQTLGISPTEAGTYYIDVHSEGRAPRALAGFTLSASTPSVGPLQRLAGRRGQWPGGRRSRSMGSALPRNTQYSLNGPGGHVGRASWSSSRAASRAFVTFNLTGAAVGAYTLHAFSSNGTDA